MTVDVHRDGDRRVAEALLYDFRVDLGREQVAGMAVSETVQGDAIDLQKCRDGMGQAARLKSRTVCLGDDVPTVALAREPRRLFSS